MQCTYLGYWSTTGLTEMDWAFVNPDFPPALDAHFTEQLWRMPRHTHCYLGRATAPRKPMAAGSRGRPAPRVFQPVGKIREQTLALWAKVLHALPQARLLLEDSAACEQQTHQRILATLAAQGIAAQRVCFIPHLPGHQRHMALYHRLDIALDTIPFNSGTTAFDALWMGVPLVAIEGGWSGARIASAVLRSFGRPDWVARNETEFVSIVSRLAADVEGRREQRARQRARMLLSPLCDAPAMARAMENALEGCTIAGPRIAGPPVKAVILAGGLGSRLSEETTLRPKPMVEVGGKPILWHIMKIYSSYGINEFIVCLGYKGQMIKEFFLTTSLYSSDVTFDLSRNTTEYHRCGCEPWRVTLVDTGTATMTGGRLRRILPYVDQEELFCFTYGDGVADIDLDALIAFHRRHGKMVTLTAVQPTGRFGALGIDEDGTLLSFAEKPGATAAG